MSDKQILIEMIKKIGYDHNIREFDRDGCDIKSYLQVDVPVIDHYIYFNFNSENKLISIE